MSTITRQRVHGTTDIDGSILFQITDCANCGVIFAITERFDSERRSSGKNFYCPNGHPLVYNNGKSALDIERDKRERAERAAEYARASCDAARDQARAAERTNIALRGHLTRLRNRIANGVCPVPGCKRSGFADVRRHINAKHPQWAHDHTDAMETTP